MTDRRMMPITAIVASLLALPTMVALSGCGSPDAKFVRYEVFVKFMEKSTGDADFSISGQQKQDVDTSLQALYGTPDEPRVPVLPEIDTATTLDIDLLKLAAGRVGSDETGRPRGLYREHCAHCHGITGDGAGPTASFLNPYPRDYRPGKFKFKSTPIGQRPTHADLKKVLLEGIPGTAMPSFRLLSDQEVESLVHYVKYLSIRGETERQLYYATVNELEENARLIDPTSAKEGSPEAVKQQEQLALLKDKAKTVFEGWQTAGEKVTEVPLRPTMSDEQLAESRKVGRQLFFGSVANCFSCHGPTALGDGQLTDYDQWTLEFITKTPTEELIDEYVSVGMHPPRNIRPRNLRHGVYRGGMRPVDLFWRIKNGIEGSPMPGNDKLTSEQIWHLVNYVQSLPYEQISDPHQAQPDNQRERM